MNRLKLLAVISVLLCSFIYSQGNNNSLTPLPVQLMGTHLLHVQSAVVDQEYDLYVNLPKNYKDSTKTFPVLYLVDGQWDFALVQGIYGQQYYDGFVPDIVIVGITWGGKNPDYDVLRRRDLTPSFVQQAQPCGNAAKFLEVIKKELIPFIESKYRVNKDRTLLGSSFGGLFTLFALFTEENLFNRYVLTSPSLHWDNGFIYGIEKTFSEKNSSLPVKLFMGIGEYEDVQRFQKFADLLKERNYKGLEIETHVVKNCGHSGAKAEGYARGIQFAYRRPLLEPDKSVLEQYVGLYEVFQNIYVKLIIEDNQLTVIMPDKSKIKLLAETENDFYIMGQRLFVHFQKDDSGKVINLSLETYGGKQVIKKVRD